MGMVLSKYTTPAIPQETDYKWAQPFSKSFPLKKVQNAMDASISLFKTVSATCRKSIKGVTLAFRASQHKFKSQLFHQLCCDKANTVVIALTVDSQVYGGFTPCPWKNDEYITYSPDEHSFSFLFSIAQQGQLQTYPIKSQSNDHAIMNDQQLGPVFGQGHDLLISDQSDKKECWNNIGKTYRCEFPFGSIKANSELTGQQKFVLREYQVWQVLFH